MIHSQRSVQLCALGCTDLVLSVDGELERLRLCEQTCTHRKTESSRRAAACDDETRTFKGNLGRELLVFSGVTVSVQVPQPQLDC